MSSIMGKQARSLGFATALLSQIFLGSAAFAQEERDFPIALDDIPPATMAETSSIQALLQDLSDHPLAGSVVNIEVCANDGLDRSDCDMIEAELPLPQLNNPLGYEVQALRRELAWLIEQAPRDEDGQPLATALQEAGAQVIVSFERFLDAHSTEFQKPNTLIRMMDMHYALINISRAADLAGMEQFIQDLREVTVQLEDDLLSDAEKALRDAQEALQEALENGASEEEIAALNEQMMEALEAYIDEQQESGDLSPAEMQALEDMQALMEALKELLEELGISPEEFAQMMQNMMQNMQSGPPPAGQPPEMSIEEMIEALKQQIEMMQKMQKYMEELNAIIEEQQAVRDETLSRALRHDNGQPHPDDAPTIEELEERQEALEERLGAVVDEMGAEGLPTDNLDVAIDEMDEAEGDLERGRAGEAVPDQDEALEALRQASQNMQAMMMMMMPGSGPLSGTMDGAGPPGGGANGDSFIDGDGNLRSSDNPNEALGIETDDPNNLSRGIRDEILERRRQQEDGSAAGSYLDRLLQGPDGP